MFVQLVLEMTDNKYLAAEVIKLLNFGMPQLIS